MTIVPWATLQPTRTLAASARPHAPAVEETPSPLASLLRRLGRHS
ncbi:hypothetical protein [Microlunatus ginsengisoli]